MLLLPHQQPMGPPMARARIPQNVRDRLISGFRFLHANGSFNRLAIRRFAREELRTNRQTPTLAAAMERAIDCAEVEKMTYDAIKADWSLLDRMERYRIARFEADIIPIMNRREYELADAKAVAILNERVA